MAKWSDLQGRDGQWFNRSHLAHHTMSRMCAFFFAAHAEVNCLRQVVVVGVEDAYLVCA